MINDYKIVNEKGKEVLYLYLNYEYEFASFFNRKKIKSIKKTIINFITNKRINFNGNKAILILNGIMIGTVFLGNINNYRVVDNDYKYIAQLQNMFKNVVVEKEKATNNLNIEESIENIENKSMEKQEIQNKNTIQNKTIVNNNTSVNNPKNVVPSININEEKKENIVESPKIIEKQENINPPLVVEEVKKEKMVNIIRSNGSIITIPLEEYIIGVVGAEMPASFNIEALKSQAVIARTYALKRIEEGKVLTDTTINQVYKDNNQLREVWGGEFDKYYNKIVNSVDSTKGEVIKYDGKYIDAVYHSTSNGYTEDPLFVWGYIIPYLKQVDSHWDLSASSYLRNVSLTTEELSIKLETEINSDSLISIIEKSPSNRINYIQIGDKIINGVELYNLLGLRSRDFDMTIVDNIVNITTRGYGHGVGLSQYGANGMAKEGYNYKQIINHYYNNINIVQQDL